MQSFCVFSKNLIKKNHFLSAKAILNKQVTQPWLFFIPSSFGKESHRLDWPQKLENKSGAHLIMEQLHQEEPRGRNQLWVPVYYSFAPALSHLQS